MGTDRDPVPVTGLAENLSSMPRGATPPFGKVICGSVKGNCVPLAPDGVSAALDSEAIAPPTSEDTEASAVDD